MVAAFCGICIRSHRIVFISGCLSVHDSIATMDSCIRHFQEATGCGVVEALEAATLHPAQLLRLDGRKGTLDFGAEADFVLLDDGLTVRRTYVAGQLAWDRGQEGLTD